MKLISMVDYVFEMRKNQNKDNITRFWACETYAKFLSMPLTLGMFVPCKFVDGNWVFFEKPVVYDGMDSHDNEILHEYQKALSNVIFEGFEYQEKRPGAYSLVRFPDKKLIPLYPELWTRATVENLISRNLTISQSAITKYQI